MYICFDSIYVSIYFFLNLGIIYKIMFIEIRNRKIG